MLVCLTLPGPSHTPLTLTGELDPEVLGPNPISTPYAFPFPLQNKGEGQGVRGRNGIGPKC